MIIIIGGAYQGKLAYALERFNLTEEDVYACNDEETVMPQGKRIINGLEKWLLALVRNDVGIPDNFINNCKDTIIICNDISCGVVPVDRVLRRWREAVGRALGALAQQSDEVVRLFCGIPTRIK
ncbi:MAG: bifunctional adenosylcobinamide kinase/adenosylcobinamide-phosphate guanylyltransferase [Defluviitaleaceae bacterium]|nr:bifunctional adenosylcobinamide kinase/adenosylcobinamide-phosphate guanylyltransferase [Defluviitaleaceae bacterium]